MTDPTTALTGRWLHSFEEDHGDVTVYRPPDHDFPPARGRRGIEFAPDGSFTEWAIGRGDAPQAVPGRWRTAAAGQFEVTTERTGDRVLEVVHQDPERLEVRWRTTS
ncbi:hypothetical protein SAMN05660209_01331 [Geodermatophilus africanus]|jgi:hypothetical protein|uniref:Lipocalin-like domain-containing protein n=1 Tax=Geodermatophilus africanus TaxID=1137993 RepID=A0A1H3ET75_9ACTN|nr:hypothetical protein [Geodermatophilus africanus]SDX81119.1 hypothetical protein SAMN05660209_01331 [Geodermatophilus africanus]